MKKLLHLMLLFFVIGISNAQPPVHRFNFESNLQNTANNLTLTGANITYEAGRNAAAGQAMVINNNVNSNSYIDTTINGLSTTGGAFSFCFWAKLNTNTRMGYENRYISIGTNTTVSGVNRGFTLWQDRNNNFDRFAVNCGAGTFPAAQFLSSPATTWNFFALVYDGSGTVKLYRNGTLESATTTATNITLGNLILKMGRWNDTIYDVVITSSYSMDDLQLFNVALTDAQVATIYSPAQVPMISAVSSSPVGTTTATINYIINAGGAATTPIIRYGLSSTTLNNSQTGAVVNGSTTIAQDVNLIGLTAGTTYFYKVEASNLVGSATPSSTLSFATTVATIAPIISSVSSSSVTVNAATINYSINAGGAATTPVIRYGLTAANLNLNQTGTVANGTTATAMSTSLTGLTSGTTYFYRVEASNSAGSATPSSTLSFTTTGSTATPVITSVNTNPVTNSAATVNFDINTSGIASPTTINYGISASALTSAVQGPIVTSSTAAPTTINVTNLLANTTYFYQVVATNSNGSGTSTVNSFTTLVTPPAPTPLYHYKFSGNLNEENGGPTLAISPLTTLPFSFPGNNSLLFQPDGLSRTPFFTASLSNLPQGASARTVSVRMMYESGALGGNNFVFNWGQAVNNQSYGYSQVGATGNNYYWGPTDLSYTNSINFGTWYTMTFVYDGTNVTIYRDGLSVSQAAKTLNTQGTTLRLGSSTDTTFRFLHAKIDDLQIYNIALTAAQIASLNGVLLSNNDFKSNNFKFNLFPNPASSILNIEIASEIKSVLIYNLLGQKISSSKEKQINISTLSPGVYMAKVEDDNGVIAVQKFIKE